MLRTAGDDFLLEPGTIEKLIRPDLFSLFVREQNGWLKDLNGEFFIRAFIIAPAVNYSKPGPSKFMNCYIAAESCH